MSVSGFVVYFFLLNCTSKQAYIKPVSQSTDHPNVKGMPANMPRTTKNTSNSSVISTPHNSKVVKNSLHTIPLHRAEQVTQILPLLGTASEEEAMLIYL